MESNPQISDAALENIADLAKLQLDIEERIEKSQQELEELQDRHKRISESLLPEAMMSIGMEKFTLKNGASITVSKYYSASIPKDRTVLAFKWLREQGFSEIIKREIKCKFGKGEDDIATSVAMDLAARKIPFDDKEAVHPQTLKAFVREQIEAGHNLPMEDLGVYVGNKTKITPATK